MSDNRLTRSESDKMIAGVCGGISSYIGVDSALVRLAFVILLFASGIGFPIYLILWFIMPARQNVSKPGPQVLQDNMEEMGDKFTTSINRIGKPGTIGIGLILLGAYFLFSQMGWLSWVSGVFWPMLIIGAGVFMLARKQ